MSAKNSFIENQYLRMMFDVRTKRLSAIINKDEQIRVNVSQDFLYYRSHNGGSGGNQPSGAYVFRPFNNDTTATPVRGRKVGCGIQATIVVGVWMSEVRQVFSTYASQVEFH